MNPIVFIIASVAVVLIGLPLLAIIVYVIWVSWQTRSRRPKDDGYHYVYVEDDGSAREIAEDEREYLETEYHPNDGARPYIKLRYESLNGWGSIAGYLNRAQLPASIQISPVPSKPKTSTDINHMIEAHKKAGDTIIEKPDGSLVITVNRDAISNKERKAIFNKHLFNQDDEIG
jgi:hypothetical protein